MTTRTEPMTPGVAFFFGGLVGAGAAALFITIGMVLMAHDSTDYGTLKKNVEAIHQDLQESKRDVVSLTSRTTQNHDATVARVERLEEFGKNVDRIIDVNAKAGTITFRTLLPAEDK